MLKIIKIGIMISGKEYYGLMNQSWKFLGPITQNMREDGDMDAE